MWMKMAQSSNNFNEANLKNGDITPDTLGIFISYLINKLKGKVKKLNILDPVIGSGNLLYSVANHLECDLHLFGIDNVREFCDIASIQGDLLNYEIEIFCQDTLDHPFSDIDIVVSDIPGHTVKAFDKEYYFPYMCVLQHMASLKEDGYFIGIVPNDFFEHDEEGFFKENIVNHGSVLCSHESDCFQNQYLPTSFQEPHQFGSRCQAKRS